VPDLPGEPEEGERRVFEEKLVAARLDISFGLVVSSEVVLIPAHYLARVVISDPETGEPVRVVEGRGETPMAALEAARTGWEGEDDDDAA